MKFGRLAPAVGLLIACGGEVAPKEQSATELPLWAEITALARPDADLSKGLRAQRAFVASGASFETTPDTPADAAFVRVAPGRGFELALSRRNRPIARLRADTTLALEAGSLVSAPEGDLRSLWLQSGDKLEQLLLSSSGKGVELDWHIELQSPIVAARLERSGALLLTDAHDSGILRVPVPYALDADGSQVLGQLSYELRRAPRLAVDVHFSVPDSARPPLLIDPALAVVTWQASLADSPSGRVQGALAYHPGLHAVVLHGGTDDNFDDAQIYGETWAFDGAWRKLEPLSGGPQRYSHALAYSATPPSLLLFGGRDQDRQLSGSTLRWENGVWTEVATTGPTKRENLGMVYAPGLSSGDVLLLGGKTSAAQADTWIWNGTAWNELSGANGEAVYGHALVFDDARRRAVTFGGQHDRDEILSTLELFDGSRWSDTPAPNPPIRAQAAAAFDTDRQRMVLFGGEDQEQFFHETWEWDSKTARWSERVMDVHPPALSYGNMAYDPERKRSVLVGGWFPSFDVNEWTWEYRTLGGTCETSEDCDGVACVDGACCASIGCGTCEACSTATGACESVTGRPDPDSCDGAQTCDAKGNCKQATAATCKSDGDCESGSCADGVCCDRACDGACEACDLDGALGQCSYVKGAARHGSCEGDAGCVEDCSGDSADCNFVSEGTTCDSSCKEGSVTVSACDGRGACVSGESAKCPQGLECDDASTCLRACAKDADCRAGLDCRNEACLPAVVHCSGRSTLQELDGDERSCAPYACASGQCLESCQSAAECAAGLVCDENDACIPPPKSSHDSGGGCGCRVAGEGGGVSGGLAALGCLAWLRSARSRRGVAKARRRHRPSSLPRRNTPARASSSRS